MSTTETQAATTPVKPLKRWMHWRHYGHGISVLIIYERKTRTRVDEAPYVMQDIPSDIGRGFKLDKIGVHGDAEKTSYHVHVGGHGEHSCECRSHLRWGQCKHTSALLKLIGDGRISGGIPAAGETEDGQ